MKISWSPPTRIEARLWLARKLLPRAHRLEVWCVENGAMHPTPSWNHRYRIDTEFNQRQWQEIVDAPYDFWSDSISLPHARLNDALRAHQIEDLKARSKREKFDRKLFEKACRIWPRIKP
jgi:hypothetical protein